MTLLKSEPLRESRVIHGYYSFITTNFRVEFFPSFFYSDSISTDALKKVNSLLPRTIRSQCIVLLTDLAMSLEIHSNYQYRTFLWKWYVENEMCTLLRLLHGRFIFIIIK